MLDYIEYNKLRLYNIVPNIVENVIGHPAIK